MHPLEDLEKNLNRSWLQRFNSSIVCNIRQWLKHLFQKKKKEETIRSQIPVKTRYSIRVCCVCSIQRYFEANDLQILRVWTSFRVSWSVSTRFICKADMLTKVPFSSYKCSQILSKKRFSSDQTSSVINLWSSFESLTGCPCSSYVCGPQTTTFVSLYSSIQRFNNCLRKHRPSALRIKSWGSSWRDIWTAATLTEGQ